MPPSAATRTLLAYLVRRLLGERRQLLLRQRFRDPDVPVAQLLVPPADIIGHAAARGIGASRCRPSLRPIAPELRRGRIGHAESL